MQSLRFLFLPLILSVEAFEKPRNTLTRVGQRTILRCCSSQTNSELHWLFKKWNTEEYPSRVCDKQMCRDKYTSQTNDTCLNLVIQSTTHEHAGLYQCVEDGGTTTGAYLVVYDNFTCGVSVSQNVDPVEGETVVFHCSVIWIGKLPFEIQWATDRIINKTVLSEQLKQNIYTTSLKVVVERPVLRTHTANVVYRNEGTSDENIDMSTPNTSWTSPNYLVMYPVSNVRTSCHDDNDCRARPGDSIKCSADGHPNPDFRWLDWDNKLASSDSMLFVNFSGSHKFYCIATNTIRGIEHKQTKSIALTVDKEMTPAGVEEMSRDSIIGIVVGVGLFVVIVVVVILVVVVLLFFTVSRMVEVVNRVNRDRGVCKKDIDPKDLKINMRYEKEQDEVDLEDVELSNQNNTMAELTQAKFDDQKYTEEELEHAPLFDENNINPELEQMPVDDQRYTEAELEQMPLVDRINVEADLHYSTQATS